MKNPLLLILFVFLFITCKKATTDLPRNNPHDKWSPLHNTLPPNLVLSKFQRTSGGYIYAGNGVDMQIFLKNTGEGIAKDVHANITSTSTYINIKSFPNRQFYDINVGEERMGIQTFNTDNYTFTFIIDWSTPVGTVIPFNMDITASPNYHKTETFSLVVH